MVYISSVLGLLPDLEPTVRQAFTAHLERPWLKQIQGVTIHGSVDSRQRIAVLSINLAGLECGELGFLLENNFGIVTRFGRHCAPLAHQTIGTLRQGTCRISLSYFFTHEQIETFE